MIDAGTYVRMILEKRNMSQADLIRKMRTLKLAEDRTIVRPKLNYALNHKMGYIWARRIEIALELPDYVLIKMIGKPTESEWKTIKGVKKAEI